MARHKCALRQLPVPSLLGGSATDTFSPFLLSHRHVGLIKIQGKEFDFTPIRLRSVRPFLFEEISLAEYHDQQTDDKKKLMNKQAVTKYLKVKVSYRPSSSFRFCVFGLPKKKDWCL